MSEPFQKLVNQGMILGEMQFTGYKTEDGRWVSSSDVTQDADGFQKGVATGGANGLARFKQKLDGKDEYIEGEAERIEHDAHSEVTQFFVRAWVKNGQDEVKGHYISYNSLTENYLVTNGAGDTKTATGAPQARVRAIIQPKGKNAPAADAKPGEPLKLKPAETVAP